MTGNINPHYQMISTPIIPFFFAETLDKHAPEIVREVTDRTKIPWYNDNIGDEIHKRRCLEQIWKRKGDADSYIDFYHQRRLVNNMLESSE